jgi:hypothetical protein
MGATRWNLTFPGNDKNVRGRSTTDLGRPRHPVLLFGIEPTLFDARSRRDRQQSLDWLAHSFLCASSTDPMDRDVVALAGFSWGFVVREGDVDLVGAQALAADDWTRHLEMLSAEFPTWRFARNVL